MKNLIAIALFMLITVSAHAEPFLVCDPQPNVTEYKIVWAAGGTEYLNAESDGSFRYDVADTTEGDTGGDLYAGGEWLVDGEPQDVFEWSDPRPFVLTRPSAFPIPTGVRLIK